MENTKNVKRSWVSDVLAISAIMVLLYVLYYLIKVLLQGFLVSCGLNIPVLVYELAIVALWWVGIYIAIKKYKP
ncbi:MAG: hypothetical protein QHH10_04115 [Peptococcaceae bacterium]|jgi:hypothetical protein|nr:hypothetical protein [Peptococcaceae bacterium]MDH7524480.1 hypothetical protein [Peptococcaceae bacterium]